MIRISIRRIGIVLLYLFIISIYCFDGDPQLNKVMYAVGVLFIAAALISMSSLKRIPSYFAAELIPFVLICFLSCIWSISPSVSFRRSVTLLENMIVFWVMWLYITQLSLQDILIKAIALAGSIFAVYIVAYYGGLGAFIRLMQLADARTRIGGDVAHLSVIGQSLSFSGVITFFLALTEKGWKRIFRYIMLLIQIIVILASQSRTGLMLVVIGVGVIMLGFMKNHSSKGGIATVAVILVVSLIMLRTIDLSNVLERWQGIFTTGSKDSSSLIRLDLINEGLRAFFQKPILGYGIGASSSLSTHETYFHNNYVELLATIGIVGFTLYYKIFVKSLIKLFKLPRETEKDESIIGITKVMVLLLMLLMFFTVTYYVKYLYLFIVLILSVDKMEHSKKGI